ncbi:MAG TPA: hypothetical protein VIF09_04140 [Polyangiaceae bacterium]|jgi:hypothetical protein
MRWRSLFVAGLALAGLIPAACGDGSSGSALGPDGGSVDGSTTGDAQGGDSSGRDGTAGNGPDGGMPDGASSEAGAGDSSYPPWDGATVDAPAGPICGSGTPAQTVSTYSSGGVTATITWYGGCWYYGTIYNVTGNFQSIDFDLTTSAPVALEGSLFFAPNCDPVNGIDNMNDYGTTTGTTHMVQGFSHHPDTIPSSALFWLGPRTQDGMCPPGGACSGCINYDLGTPCCGSLP